MLSAWLKEHFQWVWRVVWLGCALPALVLLADYTQAALGPNPLARLVHLSGYSALVILCLTLCITPMRRWLCDLAQFAHLRHGKRLADWNWLIRLRRPLGLWSFAYALAHGWLYMHLDLGWDWASLQSELGQKPYLLAGALALLLLIPLALTSHTAMVRLLGRQWRRLHRLTYVVAVCALLHYWWMQKPGQWTPWPETLALGVLLGCRLAWYTGMLQPWDGFEGGESRARSSGPAATPALSGAQP